MSYDRGVTFGKDVGCPFEAERVRYFFILTIKLHKFVFFQRQHLGQDGLYIVAIVFVTAMKLVQNQIDTLVFDLWYQIQPKICKNILILQNVTLISKYIAFFQGNHGNITT